MNKTELRYPRTRIKPAAKKWLEELFKAYENLGLNRSQTDIASEAILLLKIPNNGHQPLSMTDDLNPQDEQYVGSD
jgi:hypothetical protein